MAAKALPHGSTLRSIEQDVTVEYLSTVLQRVWYYQDNFGNAVVSLGLRSNIRCPDYHVRAEVDENTGEMHCASFNGSTHELLTDDRREMRAVWSTGTMTYQEVQELVLERRKSAKG